ncbi:MAG: PAS domain S-box protein [Limisphaerales bacterium]
MNNSIKILILEEQAVTADLLKDELHKERILFQARQTATVTEFAVLLPAFAPDLILARHSLPGCDAMAALAAARRECSHVPFILTGAATEEDTALQALQQGATDYVPEGQTKRLVFAARRALREVEEREALRKSDARYRRVLQETGQVVYDFDLASGRIEWEGATAEVLGYDGEEMQKIGPREWEEMVHPEDRKSTLEQLDNAITSGRGFRVEYRFRRKDGVYIFVDEHGSFLRDESGRTVRMLGTMSDITERKNAEDRNLEQARLLYLAHDAILARNLDDTIVYWNESAERLYGWSAEEALGRNADQLLQELPSKAAECKRAILEHEQWNTELIHTTKSGEQVLVEAHLTLVRDRQGNPKSILSINRDITARKKMETQLMRSQRMESIGTLASGIAHDLNNVLSPILIASQLLSTCDAEGDRKQWIEMISRSAQRGAGLIKQILSFGRGMDGRRMELQIKTLIGEVTNIVRETFPKSIKFQTKVGRNLWSVVVDPTQLHQVLLNLCVNARDAMPRGGVLTIAAENVSLDSPQAGLTCEARPRPHLMITVADTGTGIPPEIREKIFDPFFTTKQLGKGTGLGLSTSLGIVKSHGGFIDVYSEPGAGTVFKVYIPAKAGSDEISHQADEEQFPRGNGELVLVVDDEAAVRTISAQTLQAFGYNVITACDGAEAIELFGRHSNEVALILIDMMMPVMDGRTTIHALCRRHHNLQVIATSGLFSEIRMANDPGKAVKASLPKPYTAETLLKTIRKVLAGHGRVASSKAQKTATNQSLTLN